MTVIPLEDHFSCVQYIILNIVTLSIFGVENTTHNRKKISKVNIFGHQKIPLLMGGLFSGYGHQPIPLIIMHLAYDQYH